jgi:hypothetical protein
VLYWKLTGDAFGWTRLSNNICWFARKKDKLQLLNRTVEIWLPTYSIYYTQSPLSSFLIRLKLSSR